MLDKILNKYYLRKIATDIINRMTPIYFLDFMTLENKNSIEIFFNYVDETKKMLLPKKITTIKEDDIVSIVTDYNGFIKMFKEKIEYLLK